MEDHVVDVAAVLKLCAALSEELSAGGGAPLHSVYMSCILGLAHATGCMSHTLRSICIYKSSSIIPISLCIETNIFVVQLKVVVL